MDSYTYDYYTGAAGQTQERQQPTADEKPPGGQQQSINDFWNSLISKSPTKVFQIFPKSLYEHLLPPILPNGAASFKNAAESYEAAAALCKARVERIVRECHRTNEKFTDADFDLKNDPQDNCLQGILSSLTSAPAPASGQADAGSSGPLLTALGALVSNNVLDPQQAMNVYNNLLPSGASPASSGTPEPQSVHRVDYVFEEPRFLIDGFSSTDVQQGGIGDCWWVAAVANVCSLPSLMDRICVARDAECGVYGFVFYRDGEWISTVVDDNLYLE
jgi:Calpain family cysteine protease